MPRALPALIGLLLAAIPACGGEPRFDVTLDSSPCKPACTIGHYQYFVTPPGDNACFYQNGQAAVGKEIVLPALQPSDGSSIGLIIAGFCSADANCPRCVSSATLPLDEGSRVLSLMTVPGCVQGLLPTAHCTH